MNFPSYESQAIIQISHVFQREVHLLKLKLTYHLFLQKKSIYV